MILPNQENQPEVILNPIIYTGITHKVYLPVINDSNGPFRLALISTSCFINIFPNSHLYIVVIDSKSISNIKGNVKDITTQELIEESMKNSPSYYVAAVINANQYLPGHVMSYILGAGDNTTDPNGRVFHNRQLRKGPAYVFRVFSVDSSSEVIYIFIFI